MALLDLLGRRGTLRLLWELRDGHPQSFRLLRASADDMSPSVLNARLKELREACLVELVEAGYTLSSARPGAHQAPETPEPMGGKAGRLSLPSIFRRQLARFLP